MNFIHTEVLQGSQNYGPPLVLNFGGQISFAKPFEEFSDEDRCLFQVWKDAQIIPIRNLHYFPEILLPGIAPEVLLRNNWGIGVRTRIQEEVEKVSEPVIFIDGDSEGNFQKLKTRLCAHVEHVSEVIEAFAINGNKYEVGAGKYKIALFLLWIAGNSDGYSIDSVRKSLVYVYFGSRYCESILSKHRSGEGLDEKEQIILLLLGQDSVVNLRKHQK